jgi:hypothetical protein
VTKSGRADEGRVHERINIENSSGDPSSVDDGHLQKPSKPKYGAAANLSVRRPESITQKDHKVIMRALCTQLLKPSVPSPSIVESSEQARSISSKFLICNGGLGESCTPPEIVLC